VKWGGFASSSSQETTGPSTRPIFDGIVERGSLVIKTKPLTTSAEDKTPPSPPEESHKPFNHEFDEPLSSTETQTPASSRAGKASSAKPQSLLTIKQEGKHLSRKQKALLQAAAISRTPLPNLGEKEEQKTEEAEATSEPRMETDEEKKQFQSKVWNLVRGKWF